MSASSRTYPLVADRLPEGEQGVAAVRRFVLTSPDCRNSNPALWVPPGTYTKLVIDGVVMMSDTPHEDATCAELLAHARGSVLIAGLGIGMVLPPVLAKPTVTRVLVLEKYPEVIDLVAASVAHPKLEVRQADALVDPVPDEPFDTVYFDIWPTINDLSLPEMAALRKRFAPCYRDRATWVGCWAERQCREMGATIRAFDRATAANDEPGRRRAANRMLALGFSWPDALAADAPERL
jgi:hypothetical protein